MSQTEIIGIVNVSLSCSLSWQGPDNAGGYQVYIRNATGGPYASLANTAQTCEDYFLYPGIDTYQFAVAAYNGNQQSNMGPGVIPPKGSGTSGTQTGVSAPSWCPSFDSPPPGGYVGACAGCGGGGGSGSAGGGGTTVIGGTTVTTISGGHTITIVVGGTTAVVAGSGTTTVIGGTTKKTVSGGLRLLPWWVVRQQS